MNKINEVIKKKLRKNWGEADDETGNIYIDPRCSGRKELEIYNHESLHILAPFLDEEYVKNIAAELTRVLWEAGFRHVDFDDSQPLQDEVVETT